MEGNLSMRLEDIVEKDSLKSRYIKEQNRKLIDKIDRHIDRQIGSEEETKKRRERQNLTGKISQ